MKTVVSLCCLLFVGLVSARTLFYGVTADKRAAWMGSTRWKSWGEDVNNVVVLAMGYRFPWKAATTERAPFWGIGYAEDNDAVSKDLATRLSSWSKAFGMVLSFNGLAEYCEKNGRPGVQWKSSNSSDNDDILRFVSWRQTTWNDLLVGRHNATSQLWANASDASETFSLECRGNEEGTIDGIAVGNFDFKCDIHVAPSKIWTSTAVACDAADRYVALRVFFAAGKVDAKDGEIINKTRTDGQGELTFGDGIWFRFKKKILDTLNKTESDVHAQCFDITETIDDLPSYISVVKECAFSFLTPYAETPGVLEWDPVFGLDPTKVAPSNAANLSASLVVLLVVTLLAALFH